FFFQLLKQLEVLPVRVGVAPLRVVLNGSDAGACNVLQGSFDGLAPLLGHGGRDDGGDQFARCLPQHAIRLAIDVPANFAALGIFTRQTYVRHLQRQRVRNRDVAIDTLQVNWVV